MAPAPGSSYTSFDGHRRIATGSLLTNALAVGKAFAGGAIGPVLVFDDATGRTVEIDARGSDEEITARLNATNPARQDPSQRDAPQATAPRGRGRPRLGVVAREVTLLPRHWEWLAGQPGGASVALRKLVEEARRTGAGQDGLRRAQERAYHFMLAIAGDLPGFEEATRALFAGQPHRLGEIIAGWPGDVRTHVLRLASADATGGP